MSEISSTYVINGLGPVPYQQGEYTDQAVVDLFESLMSDLKRAIAAKDEKAVAKAMQELEKLAKEGKDVNKRKFYLSPEMLGKMNLIFTMLEQMGIKPEGGITGEAFNHAIDTLNGGIDIGTGENKQRLTIEEALNFALDGLSKESQTVQAMIETILVQEAVAHYEKMLKELQDALGADNDALKTLTKLQELLNKVQIKEAKDFPIPPRSIEDIPKALQKDYIGRNFDTDGMNDWEKEMYKTKLEEYLKSDDYFRDVVTPLIDKIDLRDSYDSLMDYRKQIEEQLKALDGIDPEVLKKLGQTTKDIGALSEALHKIKDKLDQTFAPVDELKDISDRYTALVQEAMNCTDPKRLEELNKEIDRLKPEYMDLRDKEMAAMTKWIMDGRDDPSGTEAGAMQKIISDALAAAGTLSGSAKDSLRAEMSNFDQYIKLASALLDVVKKVIEKFAQGVAR